jgi:CRP-like cAMP-binding protein/cytochrome P450
MKSTCPFGFGAGKVPRPPKVKGLPLVGNTLQILQRPWGFLQDSYRAFGSSFRVSVKGKRAVVLAGPEVRGLYSEAGDNFLDRAFFYERLEVELSAKELIFRTKGHRHHEMRRCASLAFSRHVAAEHLPAAAAEMVRSFQALAPGRRYDALTLAADVLIAAAGPMLGACDLRAIRPDAAQYASTMMQVAARTRSRLALWGRGYRRAKWRSTAFARELLQSWRRSEIGTGSTNYIVGCLATFRDNRGQALPDADLIALLLLTFVGTGVYINRVVAFMLYELFRDEGLRQRVTSEVDRGFANGFTYEALRDMDLLRAVYCESLRRYPIWFVVPFRAEQDFVFDGKQLCRGDVLLISAVQEHLLPQFYADPDRFDPERCLPPRNEHLRRGAFAPFGMGGRRCIATGQTEILSLLYVAVLLRSARFRGDPAYDLRLRLKPLPGPHGFDLHFEGMRDLGSPRTPAVLSARSQAETLGNVTDRLALEEADIFKAIVDRDMEVSIFPTGAIVFRQGDPPDAFYVIESGEATVRRTNDAGEAELLARLGPGDVFGELGLLRRQPRLATIIVAPGSDRLVALKCSAAAFERLLGELNIVGEELISLIQRRKVAAALARLVPSFDRDRIDDLVPGAHFRRGRPGEIFVREGDPADALYIIERGSFEVVEEIAPGFQRLRARLEPGQFFGEMGLIRNAPRAATVRVAADCDVAETLVVGKEAFFGLAEPGSSFRERVFSELGRRANP